MTKKQGWEVRLDSLGYIGLVVEIRRYGDLCGLDIMHKNLNTAIIQMHPRNKLGNIKEYEVVVYRHSKSGDTQWDIELAGEKDAREFMEDCRNLYDKAFKIYSKSESYYKRLKNGTT